VKKKVLLIRFSSIGDIVLTTPVIRCLKEQLADVEVHYATKESFGVLLKNNPYIDKLHLLKKDLKSLVSALRKENFDFVIDLHNNLRTRIIKTALLKKSYSFKKLNFEKFLLTNFKINMLPDIHIVDRYLHTVKELGVVNDGQGLDYFIPPKDEIKLAKFGISTNYIGFVLGAKFATKRMPLKKLIELCLLIEQPIIFLGGKEDAEVGESLKKALNRKDVFNACGKFNLNQSASIVKQAEQIITHDTGLMHIASAFNKKIVSVWGNTVPELGMYQYVSEENKVIVEVKNLDCRPCSKIGYSECPKKHFDCMNNIDVVEIINGLK
jgi:ADP-heptose:LPS heptosyltransferase